ncbi:hypothetical protein WCD84_12185 [Luteimonas sp. MJ145]
MLVMRPGRPFWQVYSYFHLPGDGGIARFLPVAKCADRRVSIRMGEDISDHGPLLAEACRVASRSLDYLDATGGDHASIGLRVQLHVVPGDKAAWRRSVALSRHPRISLAVPLFDDRQRTLSLVAEIVAHEGSHILDHARGVDEPAGMEAEVRAHRHALCAQLVSLGRLHSLGLPSFVLNTGIESIGRSTQAGRTVFEETFPLLQDGWIVAGTPAADTIMRRCGGG